MKRKKSAGRKSLPQRQITDAELARLNPDEHPDRFRKIAHEDPLFKSEVLPHALRAFAYVEEREGPWRSALPRAFYLLEDAEAAVVAILRRAPQPPTDDSSAALLKFANAAHEWGTELMNALRPGTGSGIKPSLTIVGLFRPAPNVPESGLPQWTTLVDSLTPFLGEIPEDFRPQRQLAMLQEGLISVLALLNGQSGKPIDTAEAVSPGYVKLIVRSVVMALQGLAARLLAWLRDRVSTFKEAALPRIEIKFGTGRRVAVCVVLAGHARLTSLANGQARLVEELFAFKPVRMLKKDKSKIAKALPELAPFISPEARSKPSVRKKPAYLSYRLDVALKDRFASSQIASSDDHRVEA